MTFTDETKEITFKTPYKDPERSELSSEGHDLLSSRVILREDDYDRGCRKPSDLEDGFYRDTIKLGPEYATGMDDEGEAMIERGDGIAGIMLRHHDLSSDGVRDLATTPYANYYNNVQNKEEQEDKERCELYDNPRQELPICEIKRFEMIKYSFGQKEEYVAIKEYEYDDLTRTNKDACHAYQEIFRNMDKGWLVTKME
ncbi:hypothetical protein Tco_0799685 [Tanacetum coccineum]|uniref:Uncharacterized protein n=1 Tax=Tanacetum coccineum TaxID=301880 RepID=A0ABQ4ZS07_9ASTR